MRLHRSRGSLFREFLVLTSDVSGTVVKNLPAKRPGFDPWVGKIPRRRNGNPL